MAVSVVRGNASHNELKSEGLFMGYSEYGGTLGLRILLPSDDGNVELEIEFDADEFEIIARKMFETNPEAARLAFRKSQIL